jgi:energy-converting hydrogenase Eha subunit F
VLLAEAEVALYKQPLAEQLALYKQPLAEADRQSVPIPLPSGLVLPFLR